MTLQPIKPGDPIRASTLNKLIDGAKLAIEAQATGGRGIPRFDASNTVIRASVKTEESLPRYAVVAIDEAMFDPNDNKASFLKEPAVRVSKPNSGTQNFAILQRPASPNQIVPACVSGVSIVELDVRSGAHQFAVPNADYTMTTAESGGAKILWKQSAAGTDGKTWGLVLFPVSAAPGTAPPPAPSSLATVVLPICRAMNPNARGDWEMPFGNTFQTEHNSRTHFAAQTGFVAVDGRTYPPAISHTEESEEGETVTHYFKSLRVSSDVRQSVARLRNAHYRTVNSNRTNVLQRPVIVYNEENGNEWAPWEDDFQWETTTDRDKAWRNYDRAACPTLDYSEVLVPGERVNVLRTETHSFYRPHPSPLPGGEGTLVAASASIVIVEPPSSYSVEFEGTSDAVEFGVWNKERMLTSNQHDVVRTTLDDEFSIGVGTHPYDYWGFDTVDLHPNGTASWHFVDIAAFPRLIKIQDPNDDPDVDPSHPSRPVLSDVVNISNTACNTRAYGLWYKTDRNGVRYPILCNVESLTYGTVIETRKVNCYLFDREDGTCVQAWNVFRFNVERRGSRLVLPEIYCAVNCFGAKSNQEVVVP